MQRALCGTIVARFEAKGLKIVGMKLMNISEELAATHYEAHRERPFYAGLVKFMTSSPVVAIALRGIAAIAMCRKMMGGTFGPDADPGTIRGDLGSSRSFNLVHGSDSAAAAERELGLFFPEGTIDWDYQSTWIYDPEDELGTGRSFVHQLCDDAARPCEHRHTDWNLHHEQSEGKLENEAPDDDPSVDGFSIQ